MSILIIAIITILATALGFIAGRLWEIAFTDKLEYGKEMYFLGYRDGEQKRKKREL